MNTRPPNRAPSLLPCLPLLGIDASLNGTGLCWTRSPGDCNTALLLPDGATGTARLAILRDKLARMLQAIQPRILVVEGYAMQQQGRREAMGEWGGVLRLAAYDAPSVKHLIIVPPSVLKVFVLGHARPGHSGKPEMAAGVKAKWGVEFASFDECDAYALARYGVAYCTGTVDRKKAEREAFPGG